MSEFPSLETGPSVLTQVDHEGECQNFYVVQGTDPNFTPCGLPPPQWFVAVNPYGCSDPENALPALSDWFCDPDGCLIKMTGVSLAQAQEALWAQAKFDAPDHVEQFNGGLYALWELADGLVVGGFDDAGDGAAVEAASNLAKVLGAQVVVEGYDAHFQVCVLSDSARDGSLYGQEVGAWEIIQQLTAASPRPRPSP